MKTIFFLISFFLFFNTSCNNNDNTIKEDLPITPTTNEEDADRAKIVSVSVSGEENNYSFSVGISSPDTGCEQYADWWEVISEDGNKLIYRRILAHSHVNEQPFVRSVSSVVIAEDEVVIVRAHMNTNGYGTKAYKGSVKDGFETAEITTDFANGLASKIPLPDGCAF